MFRCHLCDGPSVAYYQGGFFRRWAGTSVECPSCGTYSIDQEAARLLRSHPEARPFLRAQLRADGKNSGRVPLIVRPMVEAVAGQSPIGGGRR